MSKLSWARLGALILLVGVTAAVVVANVQETPSITLAAPDANGPVALDDEAAPGPESGADTIRVTRADSASAAFKMSVTDLNNGSPTFSPQFGPIGGGLNTN